MTNTTQTASLAGASYPATDTMQDSATKRARARTVRQSIVRRSLVGLIAIAGVLLTPMTTLWPQADPLLRVAGFMLGTAFLFTGLGLRLWAGLYLGGHKERTLVSEGPYGCVRNPLYLGNLLLAIGLSLFSGSLIVGTVTMISIIALYLVTIRQEERKLAPIFGEDYQAYLRDVPALVPRVSAMRRLIHDRTPCIITHFSLSRELTRCFGFLILGGFVFLLASGA